MQEKFLKEKEIIDKSEEENKIELLRSILKTKIELDNANKNFNYAEGDLIDYYSYQIKANQSKLDYLLKKVKNKGIVSDMINNIGLELTQEDNVS